jgi:ketosteroid isomerase-like protein
VETESETGAWVAQWFATIDAREPDRIAAYFADDGVFRFGNAPPVRGREAIRQTLAGFLDTLGGMRHHVTGVWRGEWEQGTVVSIEAEVTYTRLDGTRTAPLPATSTVRRAGDRIQDYRIFMDLAPLFAAA